MDAKSWLDLAALLRKEGHMSIAKDADWETTVPGTRLSALSGSLSRTPRQHSLTSRGAAGSGRRQPQLPRAARLYREPSLPVCLRDEPGGPAMISLRRYQEDSRDWRKLHPREVGRFFTDLGASLQTPRNPRLYWTATRRPSQESDNLEGLIASVAVGTLQACSEGVYWSPCFEESSTECRDIRTPMSRAFASAPAISELDARHEGPPTISVPAEISPLAVCQDVAAERVRQHVALVRFVPLGDTRSTSIGALGDFREAQLHLRTTYIQALHDMPRHLHADPAQALESGAVIYTTDVQVLRGALEEGAPWLADCACTDVITVGIQRNPRCDDQGQYARTTEKAHIASVIDHVFACAAVHEVDVLIFPPPGVGGAAGCHHPAPDAGDLLRKAALAHAHLVPRVYVCRDYRDQLLADWAAFADAVSEGRTAAEHRALVPRAAPLYAHNFAAGFGRGGARPDVRATAASARRSQSLRRARPGGQATLGTAGRTIAC